MMPFGQKGQPSLTDLADRARDAGEWAAATTLYRSALARNFRNPPLWVQYGHALKESGELHDPAKLVQAEAAYRRALVYAPRVADTHVQLGHVLKLQGRTDEAKAAYLRALALDPALAAARDELQALGWEEGDGAELKAALASLDGLAPPRRRRPSPIEQADAARDAGQWALAARHYRAVLERRPDDAAIWVQYGHALKEAGNRKDPARLAEAEAAYRRALALRPGTADTHLQLGHVLKLQEKTEEAEAAYLRAFALGTSLSNPLGELRELGWSQAHLSELRHTLLRDLLDRESNDEATIRSPNGSHPVNGAERGDDNPAAALARDFDPEWYLREYPDVARAGEDPWQHFLSHGFKERRRPNAFVIAPSRAVTDARIQCLKIPSWGSEVVLFASYSANGWLKPHVRHYLDSFRRQNISVILIVHFDRPFIANADLIAAVDGLFVREAQGFDFAAWAHVFRLHPELFKLPIVYLANDSLIGPTNDSAFSNLLARVRASHADVIGLTENYERGWHLQSYFLALKQRALASATLQKFVTDIVAYIHKEDVINQCEVKFARQLRAAGLNCEALFPSIDVHNPTSFHWSQLLISGLPFLKVEVARGDLADVDTNGWRELLAAQGYDVSLADRTLQEEALAHNFDREWYLQTYPDVADGGMDPFEHFLEYGQTEGRQPNPQVPIRGSFSPVAEAEIHCLKPPTVRGEVALFVTHSPNGRLKPHVRHYLDSLKRHAIDVVLIAAVDGPFTDDADLLSALDGMFVRRNKGYDFAAWAHVLQLHPELLNVNILYLLNDSVLGPTNDTAFNELLRRLRDSWADCIGLTENYERGWHYQSYFLAFKRRALVSVAFQRFIGGIVSFDDKEDVVNQYEVRLTWALKIGGLNLDLLFPVPGTRDHTIFDWRSLLDLGFPFLKVKATRERFPGVDITGWRELLAAKDYDVSQADRTLAELAAASSTLPVRSLQDAKWNLKQEALAELHRFFAHGDNIELPASAVPEVSIVVVVFNEAELTLRCLRSLAETVDVPAEVIIVDNASTDDTGELLKRLRGPSIIRNKEDLYFLRAVNQAAPQARGRAILLLNNDACLRPHALQAALETLHSAPDVGAVGGKLILPDGCLQEAGSIIWDDGTCVGYGRGQPVDLPEFQFRREVDYCSGAFLLIRSDLFADLNYFDLAYAPAYYEETDLCMRIRAAGYRVIYDPRVEVLHYEFASAASSDEPGSLMRRNKKIFVSHHQPALAKNHLPPDSTALFARSADRRRPRLLMIEDLLPFNFYGAGFPRSSRILRALNESDLFVTYYAAEQSEARWPDIRASFSIDIEFMFGRGRSQLDEFLSSRTGYYDVILVCRHENMRTFSDHLDHNPERYHGVTIIYDSEAVCAPRDAMRLELAGSPLTTAEKEGALREELQLARCADAVIAVNDIEASLFRTAGFRNIHVLGHSIEPAPTATDFILRKDFLFVGALGDDNSPNIDGLLWFVEKCMPLLDQFLGQEYRVHVVGPNGARRLRDLLNPRIVVYGRVEDLIPYYEEARVFIAPTRFAAGIPHKVHEAAARGVPTVATSLLASQLGWEDGLSLLVADTPEDFAAQCARLYKERSLWNAVRQAALGRITAECDPAVFDAKIIQILHSVSILPAAPMRRRRT